MIVDVVRPGRPVQVRVAVWLQVCAVVLLLGLAGLLVAYAVHYDRVISDVAARFPGKEDLVRGERDSNVAAVLVFGIPAVLMALWYAATLVPVWRGSGVGRILVFVGGGGLALLGFGQVCGGGFPLGLVALAFDDENYVEGSDDFLTALSDGSGTFGDVMLLAGGAGLLLVVALSAAIVVLLALPPSQRFFGPRAAPVGYYPAGPYMICPDPSAHRHTVPEPAEPA
jgi:hypothetical protein